MQAHISFSAAAGFAPGCKNIIEIYESDAVFTLQSCNVEVTELLISITK